MTAILHRWCLTGPALAPLGILPCYRSPCLPSPTMARPLAWSDVRGGAFAAAAILLLSLAILKYSRLGRLHGDTMLLYAHVGEARGLLLGSEVWLSGQKIGKVTDIHFRPPSVADTSARIEIGMQILSVHRDALHRDAVAQIRAGGSFIGAPVVYINPGTLKAGAIQPGDTVTTHPQADVEGAGGQMSVAAREFPVIIKNVRELTTQLKGTGGTVGAFLNGPGGTAQLARTQVLASQLGARLGGGGTVGRFMKGSLTSRARVVMARADSVRALLSSPSTSLGRFHKDSTLLAEVGDIRDQLAIIQADLDQSRGTAGRILHDSAITNSLVEAQHEMTLLFADIKKHPLRYLVF